MPAAKTFVFINSLGTDFRIWDSVAAALSGRCNLILHDKRGHGLSALGREPVAIKTYAKDIEHLLLGIGARNVVLCGISVGGLIAQQLVTDARLKIHGAVLSNTGLKIGTEESWNSRMAGVRETGLDAMSQGVMERWFSPAYRSACPEHLEIYRTMLSRTYPQGYLACCAAIRDAAVFDHGRNPASVPTLCIGGSLDASTPPELVRALAANVPDARYVEFEGAGHLPCIEQPERYADVIAGFADAL